MINHQPNNPSNEQRHVLLKKALKVLNREEDYRDIVTLSSKPVDITTIAPTMSCKGIKVGVIGAGVAGLSSVYELRKLGFDITLFEGSRDHIGGRIYTHHFKEGLHGELGAMRIPVSHETTWHYINLFKLDTIPFIQTSENNRIYDHHVRLVGEDQDEHIMKYLYPLYNLTPKERLTPFSKLVEYIYNTPLLQLTQSQRVQLSQIRPSYDQVINQFDYLNLRKACEWLGLSQGAINLLYGILGIDRGLFYNSYIELLREMYSVNFSYLYKIENGNDNLPLAFYRSFQATPPNLGPISYKPGHLVTGIFYDASSQQIKIRTTDINNQQKIESFDYVISAIPFSQLRLIDVYPLFTNKKMQAIREVNYSASQKTLMVCNERFWERTINGKTIIGGGSITDLPITTIWYPSESRNDPYGVITASYNIDLDATRIGNISDNYRVELIKRQLEYVHGLPRHYLDKVIVDYKTINWNKLDLFLGAFCLYKPEQNRLFSYSSVTPEYHNKLFFAGEHTSPYHAWIQGGLQSGMYAANALATACKQQR